MNINEYPFFIHGSEDSLDIDAYFVVEKLSAVLDENKKLCDTLSEKNGVNGNLICIADGNVTAVYKGTVDEVNNSLLATYCLHHQKYPQPVQRKMDRDICLKWLRVIRGILSHCSRTQYRPIVKEALRAESVFQKMEALSKLDFTQIADFGKEPAPEVHKFICFQIAQYAGLLVGEEIYTKSTAADFLDHAETRKFLYRQPASLGTLNYLVKLLVASPPVKSEGTEYKISEDGKQIITPFGVLSTKSEKYL